MIEDPEIEDLLRVAAGLTAGTAQLEAVEAAVRRADVLGDVGLGFALRQRAIDLAAGCCAYDRYGVHFAWCFARAQREPERFPPAHLLQHYQHVIGKLVNFPDFPRAQYEALFADVRAHFVRHGFSLRTAYVERRSVSIDFGDPDLAAEADREWVKHPRDILSESRGYEVMRQVEYDSFRGDDAAVLRLTDRWFADPHRDQGWDQAVTGDCLLPLLRAGRAAEAMARHEGVRRSIRPGGGFQWSWGPHLSLLGLSGHWDRGVSLFQTMLAAAFEQTDLLSRFHFLEHALVLFRHLVDARPDRVRLRVPTDLPWYEAGGLYDPAAVLRWIDETASDIAGQFDRRNGNTFHTDLLVARRQLGLPGDR